jgi:hypothetical protein
VSSNDPSSMPGPLPSSVTPRENIESPSEGPTTPPAAATWFHPWLLLLLAGILAGGVSTVLGEATLEFFLPELKLQERQGNRMMLPTPETSIRASLKNATLANAELGAALGLALGLAGGLARRSVQAAVAIAVCGLALGGVLGIVTSLGLVTLFYFAQQFTVTLEQDLIVSLVVHAGIWGSLGAAGGLAFALGLGERRRIGRAVIGGLLGALAATLVYEVIGAVCFPLAGSGKPIAETWIPRVLARFLIPVLSALAIGRFVLARKSTNL